MDPQSQVFRTTLSGTVTLTDLSSHLSAVSKLRAHQYPGLVDARGVHTLKFNGKELTRFAHHLKSAIGESSPAPRAVVVDDLVHFGMARLFAAVVSGWIRVGVFDDLAAAEDWLTGVKAN